MNNATKATDATNVDDHDPLEESKPKGAARRTFLAAAAAVPALAVLMAGRSASARASLPVPENEHAAGEAQGYHETEHIRKYYSSAGY